MPHLVMLYTPQLDAQTDISGFCRKLANTMLSVKDENGVQVFPTAGTRVLAYAAAHSAVADGSGDHAFIYFNVRMAKGRSAAVHWIKVLPPVDCWIRLEITRPILSTIG